MLVTNNLLGQIETETLGDTVPIIGLPETDNELIAIEHNDIGDVDGDVDGDAEGDIDDFDDDDFDDEFDDDFEEDLDDEFADGNFDEVLQDDDEDDDLDDLDDLDDAELEFEED